MKRVRNVVWLIAFTLLLVIGCITLINAVFMKEEIHLEICEGGLFRDDAKVFAILKDSDIYTATNYIDKNYGACIRLDIPKNECFKYSVTSILNDGSIKTYQSDSSCEDRLTDYESVTYAVHNDAVNIISVISYEHKHSATNMSHTPNCTASFVLIT